MRSHVVACLLGAGVVLLAGQATAPKADPWKAILEDHGASGRFQIYMHPLSVKSTYLLDTQTGEVWTPIDVTNEGQYVCTKWEACPVEPQAHE